MREEGEEFAGEGDGFDREGWVGIREIGFGLEGGCAGGKWGDGLGGGLGWRMGLGLGLGILTVFLGHPGPYPACGFVDHYVSHAVFSPLPQERDDFLSGSEFGDLETQYLCCGLDVQEPQQPVLVLRLYRSHSCLMRLIGSSGIPVVLSVSGCYACGTTAQCSAHLVAVIFGGCAGCVVVKIVVYLRKTCQSFGIGNSYMQ